jgi:hypothetical protein
MGAPDGSTETTLVADPSSMFMNAWSLSAFFVYVVRQYVIWLPVRMRNGPMPVCIIPSVPATPAAITSFLLGSSKS